MRRTWAVLLVVAASAAASCVASDSIVCPDGTVCAPGARCAAVTLADGEQYRCVNEEAFTLCAGLANGMPCELMAQAATCHDGACIADQCGNGLLDSKEACDDHNTISGDGCASDCRSAETCGNGITDPVRLVDGAAAANERCDDGNLLSHDGCSSTCDVETPMWRQVPVRRSRTLCRQAMTYDSRRGRALMFGGFDPTSADLEEVWAWDGGQWSLVPMLGTPGARMLAAMAYNATRDRVVVFGGADSSYNAWYGDTWEFDGRRWLPVSSTGPRPGFGAVMVHDPRRDVEVLFGGSDLFSDSGETWEWNGLVWERMPGNGPSPRSSHAMAYDPKHGVIVLFGGGRSSSAGGEKGDTWTYDGTAWIQRTVPVAPAARMGAAMAWDPINERMLLFGGAAGGQLFSDTWAWDGAQWSQLPVAGPSARTDVAMATDPERGGVVLYGGTPSGIDAFDDTWWWDGTTWTERPTEPAPKLNGIAAMSDPRRGRLVGFGSTHPSSVDGGTRAYVSTHWSELAPTGPRPTARGHASLVYDPGRDVGLLVGGVNSVGNPVNDGTWTWDGTQWTQVASAGALPARTNMAITHHAATGEMIAFGGRLGTVNVAETRLWDGSSWRTPMLATEPSARFGSALGYDPIRNRTLLFGGVNTTGVVSDFWEWDGTAWNELTPLVRPSGRGGASLVWDAARQRLVLFGGIGSNNIAASDSWEWDGTTWTPLDVLDPGTRIYGSTTSANAGVWRLGGTSTDAPLIPNDDQWLLRWQVAGEDERCDGRTDLDLDGVRGCDDPDCWYRCAPLCPPGVSCAPDAPRCGDEVCDPNLETCRLCPEDCDACPVRCGDHVCDGTESATSCPGDC